jgi:hypothetical protein
LLSVALSLTSRPVGVTHHRALRSPDFPPAADRGAAAAARDAAAGDHPVRSSRFILECTASVDVPLP